MQTSKYIFFKNYLLFNLFPRTYSSQYCYFSKLLNVESAISAEMNSNTIKMIPITLKIISITST